MNEQTKPDEASPAVGRSDSNVGLGTTNPRLRVVFELTDEQREVVEPLLMGLLRNPGGSIIAQVYGDGVRCKLLTTEETENVRNSLCVTNETSTYHGSAFSAEEEALAREHNSLPSVELTDAEASGGMTG